ncbi:ATP-binding protein [Mycolicibacterium farcinogenes]|uniref:sensor histidine kinase n=1 Tax=Mycolicibacterium farcinogenes TaxID=1802 RepID=UPI001C8DC2EA|nr:ATP-binding protein [Mycolicibacterium farcinogenes]QZH60890.1 ATP-binding protein [Mycolicibacterium farcinogenes]
MNGYDEEVFLDDVLVKHVAKLRRSTTLTIRADLQPTYVIGDSAALHRAVAALIDNALGNAVSVIELAVYRHGAQAVITVGDDGPRVPDDFVDRHYGGLDIVARIVASHGGTFGIAERAPCGTTVLVRLPSTRLRSASSPPPDGTTDPENRLASGSRPNSRSAS